MSDVKTTPPSSSADAAAWVNTEFAAIQKADRDANKSVVQRAITFGGRLSQLKEKVGHGKWGKWLKDNCPNISDRTAQRYMKLADSSEVRAALGKNDTVSVLSLRAALALANRKSGEGPTASDKYDRAESALVAKLEDLPLDSVEAAASASIERLNEAVVRVKTKAA